MFCASDGRVDLMVTTEQDNRTADLERRFGGTRRLYGERALERFREAHVCVIGIGGPGDNAVNYNLRLLPSQNASDQLTQR